MTKIRILHVIRPAAGGMKNHLLSLIRLARRDVFEPMAACPPGDMARELADLGIKVFILPLAGELAPLQDSSVVRRLAAILKDNKINILHAHSSKAGLVGRLAGRLAGTPVIFFTAHNSIFYEEWPRWKKNTFALAEKLLAGFTTRIIAVSGVLREELLAREGLPPDKVVTVYNGIDPRPFMETPRRKEPLASLGLPGGDAVVGTVARLAPQKGVIYFIRAAACLAPYHRANFLVVGDGPLRPDLEEEAKRLGIKERVFFLGQRDDVAKILPCLDIFVLSSVTEGLPLTILEAMAAARPVVAARVGGIPEAVRDGATGLLVPPRDEKLLAESIGDLLTNREKVEHFGESGRRLVLERFTAEAMVKACEKLYLDAVGFSEVRGGI